MAAKLRTPYPWDQGIQKWELPSTVSLNPKKNEGLLEEAAWSKYNNFLERYR